MTNDYEKYYEQQHIFEDWGHSPGKEVFVSALKKLVDAHIILKNSKVLDVGCGAAYLLKKFNDEVSNDLDLWGIDISTKAVEIAKTLFPKGHYIAGDALQSKLESDFFDIVVSYGSYEHFENPQLAISEASRVLRPGGVILTMQPTLGVYRHDREDEGWYEETHSAKQLQWNYKRATWENIFRDANIALLNDSFAGHCGALKPGNFYFGIKK